PLRCDLRSFKSARWPDSAEDRPCSTSAAMWGTSVVMPMSWGSRCLLLSSEIRLVRLGHADPLILVILDRILGADLFLPFCDQAPVGDKDGQRPGNHLRVLHGQFELQSLETGIGVDAREPGAASDSPFRLLVLVLRRLG